MHRDKSFPVPRGIRAIGGYEGQLSWSRVESTHPTVPSPPQTRTRSCVPTLRNISRPYLGPFKAVISKTWRGFSNQQRVCRALDPLFPPDLGLTNTRRGCVGRIKAVSIGFTTKGRYCNGMQILGTQVESLSYFSFGCFMLFLGRICNRVPNMTLPSIWETQQPTGW